jgi:hypothetical protein
MIHRLPRERIVAVVERIVMDGGMTSTTLSEKMRDFAGLNMTA